MINQKKLTSIILLSIFIMLGVIIHFNYDYNNKFSKLETLYINNIHNDLSKGALKESKDILKLEAEILDKDDLIKKADEVEEVNFNLANKISDFIREDKDSKKINKKSI
ncbi:hypothetical protein I3900191A7_05190 [Clostridium baratii]|uniref:hypothetical protein n=1 Tax=Clostridium baratii TaxID=1561 RepID=UPI0036F2B8C3